MKRRQTITTLFLDIGGVILSNGWGHEFRLRAARQFNLDMDEMEVRHQIAFVSYEEGKLTLSQYLKRIVFYKKRSFTPDEFANFIFEQSSSDDVMIELIKKLKAKYQLKVVAVSNEAKELNDFRIHKFKLNTFVDFFISSCYVHLRKPDTAIFMLAMDTAQVSADQVVYIEDIPLFIEVAADVGIKGIRHENYAATVHSLSIMGLSID